ncbi:MAG TPA: tetratricopeptide repeat protein, partial [Minicystis sp.]|nr:tetratricopeptide repeat protein [Minicystis sp.]
MHLRTPFLLACAVAAACSAAPAARAAEPDPELLRVMRVRFADGQLYEAAGRWADALERFREVARVRDTPQVAFHTALCLDHLGRLLEAERLFKASRDAARAIAAPDVASEADAHLADLAERIPKVYVGATGGTRGVKLFLDGAPVPATGLARVDPGPHLVTATRTGRTIA